MVGLDQCWRHASRHYKFRPILRVTRAYVPEGVDDPVMRQDPVGIHEIALEGLHVHLPIGSGGIRGLGRARLHLEESRARIDPQSPTPTPKFPLVHGAVARRS